MPRDLGDVIHYFIPEAGDPPSDPRPPREAPQRPAQSAAPVLGMPIAPGDVLRAAFAWNLSIEFARAGATSHVIAPREGASSAAWPTPGTGPLGATLELSEFANGAQLAELAALADAAALAPNGGRPVRRARCTLACIPESELESAAASACAPPRWLLLCSPAAESLSHARDLVLRLGSAARSARIGITIHGAHSIGEARDAFDALADATDATLQSPVQSYGLIADDLHLYRAIVSGRPIGLAHPQSPAARALADVARLLLDDFGEADRG